MLCAVYIVCKVLRPSNEIKFVDILAAYRTQPQFNREVVPRRISSSSDFIFQRFTEQFC